MTVVPKVKGLNCPGCGNALEIRSLGRAISVVCPACLRVLDARDPNLAILSEYAGAQRVIPEIPLGKRGTIDGIEYEAIGFQERQVMVDGVAYCWYEYLLFNPYKGYKYLVQSQNHWNVVTPIHAIPEKREGIGKAAVIWNGQRFTHFQSADAETTYVFGEFPWEVHKGEKARSDDFISPPLMLSSEQNGGELTWSKAEYRTADEIGKAFGVPLSSSHSGAPFANQPNPYIGKPTLAWKWFAIMVLAMMLLGAGLSALSHTTPVFNRTFTIDPAKQEEKAFVTEPFTVKGSGILSVDLRADVDNNEAFVGVTLINESTGRAWEFARSLSYYSGTDEGERWSEGSRSAKVSLSGIPAGTYYFRVDSEMESQEGTVPRPIRYSIKASRGSTVAWGLFLLVFFLLMIPPVWYSIQKSNFETKRWLESDYAPEPGSDSGDDDE